MAIRIGLTLGDPSGIGPEITVKALAEPEAHLISDPVVIGDPAVVQEAVGRFCPDMQVRVVDRWEALEPARPGLIQVWPAGILSGPLRPGRVSAEAGRAAGEAIVAGVDLARAGRIDALVTAPINKEALRSGGFLYPGHTEMLGELFGASRVMTLFWTGELRIFFLTRHHPLREAIRLLTVERVVEGLRTCHHHLVEMGFPRPRVALAALNPHAGENGLLGSEEKEVLIPAADQARREGLNVTGPLPADSVFYQARCGHYDGVLSLYHDQGHIAAKTLDFFGTVSVTLGLPVVRTSVDHGTAFDIAWQGRADHRGQVAALRVAARLVRARQGAGAS